MKMLLRMFLRTQVDHGQLYSQQEQQQQQQQQGVLSLVAEDDEEGEGEEEEEGESDRGGNERQQQGSGSMGGPKRVEVWPVLEKRKRSKFFHNNVKGMGLKLEKIARRCQGSSCFAAINSGEVGGSKKFWSGAALSIPADVRECIEGTFDALLSPLVKVRDAEVERIRMGMGDREGLTGAPQHVSAPSAALAPQHASEVQHNVGSSLQPSSFQLQPPLSPPLFPLSHVTKVGHSGNMAQSTKDLPPNLSTHFGSVHATINELSRAGKCNLQSILGGEADSSGEPCQRLWCNDAVGLVQLESSKAHREKERNYSE
jgi:hypothetical protein